MKVRALAAEPSAWPRWVDNLIRSVWVGGELVYMAGEGSLGAGGCRSLSAAEVAEGRQLNPAGGHDRVASLSVRAMSLSSRFLLAWAS
jgi:hypothetical protein